MARKLRIQFAAAMYHVMNRGDHQQTIFCDTVSWIAQRLAMGTRGHLAHLLCRNARPQSDLPESGQTQMDL